jgi:enoyl-CoA hydratase
MISNVMTLAAEIAEKSPVAIAGSKRMINYARDHSQADALDYIATWQAGMFAPPHMAEAFTAKAQKRAGAFPDLSPLKKRM